MAYVHNQNWDRLQVRLVCVCVCVTLFLTVAGTSIGVRRVSWHRDRLRPALRLSQRPDTDGYRLIGVAIYVCNVLLSSSIHYKPANAAARNSVLYSCLVSDVLECLFCAFQSLHVVR